MSEQKREWRTQEKVLFKKRYKKMLPKEADSHKVSK